MPSLRTRPADDALADGFNHFVVHVPAAQVGTPAPLAVDGLTDQTGGGSDNLVVAAPGESPGSEDLRDVPQGWALVRRADGAVVAVEPGQGRVPSPGAAFLPPAVALPPASSEPPRVLFAGAPGVKSVKDLGGGDFAVSTTLSRAEVAALPGVTSVGDDIWADPYDADPLLGSAWGLENDGRPAGGWAGTPDADVDATAAWERSRGAGVVVAVIDTGIDRTHPDLATRMWRNAGEVCGNGADDDRNGYIDDCDGWDFARNDNSIYDLDADNRHGTHIAGTIAAAADNGVGVAGVAPNALIMSLKVGDTGSFRLSATAAAIRYAADNGAKVINASWGTTGISREQVPWLEAAVDYARQRGVLIVAAAGNDGRNIDSAPSWPASFPHDNVVTVGASTNSDANAYFSNFGSVNVDLHAPGWFIFSTLPGGGYGTMSGTSMAAPHVAGAAALAIAADRGAPYSQVQANLLASADRLQSLAGLTTTGGRLNAATAVGESDSAVQFAFAGADALTDGEPGELRIVAAGDPELLAGKQVRYELSLVTSHAGGAYAVYDHPVGVTTAAATELSTTDDGGWFAAPADTVAMIAEGDAFRVGMTLPAGDYAVVAQAVEIGGGTILGSPQVLVFSVAPPASPPADESTPPAPTSPVPPTPTTPAPTPGPAPTVPGPTPTTPTPPVQAPPVIILPPVPPTPGYQPAPMPPGGQPVSPAPTLPLPCSNCGWLPEGPVFQPPAPSPQFPAPQFPAPQPPSSPSPVQPGPITSPPANPGPSRPTPAAPTQPAPTTPAPLPTVPAPVLDGISPRITSVWPADGHRSGGTTVMISGAGFGSSANVRVGGPAEVVSVADTLIVARTRNHAPGTVDIEVSSGGRTGVITGAFTFYDDQQPTPPPATAPAPGPAPAIPPPAAAPAPTAPTPTPPAPTTPATTAPVTTMPAPAFVEARGLKLKPLSAGHPLRSVSVNNWTVLRCGQPSCAGTSLR